MVMRKANPDTDQVSRSLLQKAVRRGNIELTKKTISFIIKNNDFDWLRKRLAVVTFEECWPYGLYVSYEKDEEIISHHYLKIASAVKNKNAAGLGSLAYALSRGDTTVLEGAREDKAIKIIAEAIKRPKDFWYWAISQKVNEKQEKLVEMAEKGFRKAGWPWDRAFAQAGAYLSITENIPEVIFKNGNNNKDFPFWTGIDKHTKEGKAAIREAAKRIGFNCNKALWLGFYFESAICNEINNSFWWEKEILWRMGKLGLDIIEAKSTWERLKPIIIEILVEDGLKLRRKIMAEVTNISIISQSKLF